MPPASSPPTPAGLERPSLLETRLVIVTGKGGTGKTTVAATLALAAARAGRRALLAEVGRGEPAAHLVAPDSPAIGYAGRELVPNLRAVRIEPFEALAEYLSLQLGHFVADRVVGNAGFRQLMTATPGWRELITLGKVWHLEQLRSNGRPDVDLIVVDAPATGHGLTFLDVPRVVASAVRSGPLRRNAAQVEALLEDPKRTRLLPVTLAEELPVRETIELIERLHGEIGIPIDRIVVNAVEPEPLAPELAKLADALDALPPDCLDGGPRPATLAHCVRHRSARRALHEHHIAALHEATQLPFVTLPYLPEAVSGPADLEHLAPHLLAEPGGLGPTNGATLAGGDAS